MIEARQTHPSFGVETSVVESF